MAGPLLTTKLHVPPTAPNLVVRPRLLALLDEDCAQHRVTLIAAPAGYGKTTLVAQWVTARCLGQGETEPCGAHPHVVWYALDEEENNATRFLTYLTVALQHAAPDACPVALAALQSAEGLDETAVLALLLNEIDNRHDSVIVVLDDYWKICDDAVHNILTYLLDHLPAALHLLLLTRAEPPLSVARLRGQGRLREIDLNDLALTAEEGAAFLAQTCGLTLPPTVVEALTRDAEGWPAGLRMTAQTVNAQADQESDEALHISRPLYNYFRQEVMAHLPKALHTFLRRTSILERLNPVLCDAVVTLSSRSQSLPAISETPGLAAEQILRRLDEANLFLNPLDESRTVYRYHRLFRRFLHQELERQESDIIPDLHRRAAGWYAAHELPAAAVDHALAAQEYELAAELVDATVQDELKSGALLPLLTRLTDLPKAVLAVHPQLLAYRAACRLLTGQPLEQAEADLDAALQAPCDHATISAMTALRSLIAAYQGRTTVSRQLVQQAVGHLPPTYTFWRTLAAGAAGLNHIQGGDLTRAYDNFLQTLNLAEQTDDALHAVLALAALGELAVLAGDLEEAKRRYADILTLAEQPDANNAMAGLAYLGQGRLHLERGRLEQAVDRLAQGVRLAHAWGHVSCIQGELWLSAAYALQHAWDPAECALRRARRLAARFDATDILEQSVEIRQVSLWLTREDSRPAIAWLERQLMRQPWSLSATDEEARQGSELPAVVRTLTAARVCLADRRPGTALSLLAAMAEGMRRPLPTRFLIDLRVSEACALHALGQSHTARQRLAQALRLAAPQAIMRPFLEQATPSLHALLTDYAPDGEVAAFTATMRARVAVHAPRFPLFAAHASQSANEVSAGESLTPREVEVLTLVAAGLTNRQIAEELVISRSTVKTHVNNLYRKLNVHTRTGALSQARRLGLL